MPDPNTLTFAVAQDQTITVTPDFLTHSLNAGTDVNLQANNSIQVNAALNLAGGSLALSAPAVAFSADATLGVTLAGTTAGGGAPGTYTQLPSPAP